MSDSVNQGRSAAYYWSLAVNGGETGRRHRSERFRELIAAEQGAQLNDVSDVVALEQTDLAALAPSSVLLSAGELVEARKGRIAPKQDPKHRIWKDLFATNDATDPVRCFCRLTPSPE